MKIAKENEKKGTVLITDPDPKNKGWLYPCLKRDGYDVELTDRISECISKIQRKDIEVLVLDVHLETPLNWRLIFGVTKCFTIM